MINTAVPEKQPSMIEWLFATKALVVCDPDSPFWYTSGTLGPYYINTHYLYGGEQAARALLDDIELAMTDPCRRMTQLSDKIDQQYQENKIFHALVDHIAACISDLSFDFISGGERRDLFFSLPTARLLGLPHLTLLKNGEAWFSQPGNTGCRRLTGHELEGQTALHIADLVTEASSYLRAWLPAIKASKAVITDTLAVIDRNQSGAVILADQGVSLHCLARIDASFLEKAENAGQISQRQRQLISQFMADPHQFMLDFLQTHPDFLEQQLAAGGKNRERARLCIEQGYGKNDQKR
jgi:orotate phosphoribosyltransferase